MADNWKNYGGGRGSGGGGGGRRGGVRGGNQQNQYARQGGENYYQGGRGRGGIGGGYDNHGSGSGGRRSGGGGERGGNYEYRYVQNQGHRGGEYYQGGGRGRGHDSYGNQQQLQGSHDGVPIRTVPQQQYHLSRSSVEPAGKMAWTGSQWGQGFLRLYRRQLLSLQLFRFPILPRLKGPPNHLQVFLVCCLNLLFRVVSK